MYTMTTLTNSYHNRPKTKTNAKKQAILDIVRQWREKKQTAPTYRELATEIGYQAGSFGTVHKLVDELIAEGYLIHIHSGSRSLALKSKRKTVYIPPNRKG